MKYNFVITETLKKVVRVEAESVSDAHDKVVNLYRNEEIVLSADDFDFKEITPLGEGCSEDYVNEFLTNENFPVDIDFTKEEE